MIEQQQTAIQLSLRMLGNSTGSYTWDTIVRQLHGVMMLAIQLRILTNDLTLIRQAAVSLQVDEALEQANAKKR